MAFLKELSENKQAVTLYKYNGNDIRVDADITIDIIDRSSDYIRICFLDLETTGTNKKEDKIIELALKVIQLNKYTGKEVKAIADYEAFQDPGIPIPEQATIINNITDEMVKDHEIDWDKVKEIFSISQLFVAHNASFDRAFLDRYLEISQKKVWACSINDINWINRGFTNSKLELLAHWHGYYYESHRAMIDVDAMIHLVIHPHYIDNKPIIELIEKARQYQSRIIVRFNYNPELVNLIKTKRYSFNGTTKEWSKIILEKDIEEETKWLAKNIYKGTFAGLIEQVTLVDKYKDR